MRPAPRPPLLGVDPPQPRPLADGELSLAHQTGEFIRRVPLAYRPLLDECRQQFLDPDEAFLNRHFSTPSLSFPAAISRLIVRPPRADRGRPSSGRAWPANAQDRSAAP